jgi:hypothetical protein
LKGKYYTPRIGEALQKIKVLKVKNDVLDQLKTNWMLISQHFNPIKFSQKTGLLTVSTKLPVIYTRHSGPDIIQRCNQFLGSEIVKDVKIKQIQ